MSIIIEEKTKLAVSVLTGREGSFHGLRNKAYGTDLVAGVTPGKGGQDVEGVPVFDTIKAAVEEAGANTSMIFVPARFAAAAIDEAIDSGVETVIAITEGIPVLDMLNTYWKAKEAGVRLIGPNCPGVLSPGKANVGIIPAQFFDPGPIEVADPPVYLAGVNDRMARVAGEVADGFCVHPLNSPEYLRAVVRPSIEEGAKQAGRDPGAVEVVAPVFTIVGDPGPELDRQRDAVRLQIAFYGTTPSYGRVFEVHGREDMTARLGAALRAGDKARLAAEIDDELLDAFSVTASWDGLAGALRRRFDGLADRIFPYHAPGLSDPAVAERWRSVTSEFANGQGATT